MTCTYCGTRNPDGEHRCQRCGRREGELLRRAVPGSAAPALAPVRLPDKAKPGTESSDEHRLAPQPLQRQLFAGRRQPKVVALDSRGTATRQQPLRTVERTAPPRTVERPTAPKTDAGRRPQASRLRDTQTKLDFLPSAQPASRKLGTTVEAVIFCDAPVAAKVHRFLAATLDLSMMVIAFGVFILGFHLAGGEFIPDHASIAVFGISFVLIAGFYGLLWAMANGDTPGKRWMHLHVINFDGFLPDRTQRGLRLCGFALGLSAAATGLLWMLVDEESLAWHDHMSRTFLTVREQDTNFFRQR